MNFNSTSSMQRSFLILFLSTALAFIGLWGCNEDNILPIVYDEPLFIIDDTTNITTFNNGETLPPDIEIVKQIIVEQKTFTPKGIKLHGSPKDLKFTEKIKNKKDKDLAGKPVKYLAIGSSLTAGVRDGGYFNEGMLTSYPNLLAIQLGVSDFKLPLFDTKDYNGTGRKVKSELNPTDGPFQKFSLSSNNLGIESITEEEILDSDGKIKKVKKVKLKPYKGYIEDLDVFALPDLNVQYLGWGANDKIKPYLDRLPKRNNYERSHWDGFEAVIGKKVDIFTIETGSNGFIPGGNATPGSPINVIPSSLTIAKRMMENGAIGCVSNVPDYSKFPVYHQINYDDLQNKISNSPIHSTLSADQRDEIGFVPNSRLDSLMSPKVDLTLNNLVFRAEDGIWVGSSLKNYNDYLKNEYDKIGIPIVDLSSLYQKIIEGSVTTHDGIWVNPDIKEGNFFSLDGVYPTPFGHAVITNEFIRTLNAYYNLSIPLIPTAIYLD